MNLKPIETVYKGYRFRSRLEARWAVFFDRIGIEFEYELQGYQLDCGWYLPDFYLSRLEGFLEVKPQPAPPIHAETRELDLMRDLCVVCQKPGLIVYGDPWNVMHHHESISFGDPEAGEDGFVSTRRSGFFGFTDRLSNDPFWGDSPFKEEAEYARQARFEHGQVTA